MRSKLLIVEDDKALVEQMSTYFSDEYDVLSAHSIAGAREFLADTAPDIAVLDLILPAATAWSY